MSTASSATPTVQRRPFGTTQAGQSVEAFTLARSGLTVELLSFGGILTQILTPDHAGKLANINLGFDTLPHYEAPGPYFGALIGRYGNRIAHGTFALNGITHRLPQNNNLHHLHGGTTGYDKRLWTPEIVNAGVRLTLTDPDGAEGYPGTVQVTVTYTLTPDNALRIAYAATTDKTTPINLTNHAYFNLSGVDRQARPILNHTLHISAEQYLPVDAGLIPTGELAPVKDTPFDFRKSKPIGQDLPHVPGGYDHSFITSPTQGVGGGPLRKVATASDPTSGRILEVLTDQPALQLYTGNFLNGSHLGHNGVSYGKHAGFCLETQHYPDSPNRPAFPSTILKPGETYRTTTEYRFGVR